MARFILAECEKAMTGAPVTVQRKFAELHSPEDTVAILYLARPADPFSFQKAATEIRAATRIPRIFTYTGPSALIVRGTEQRVAEAVAVAARN